ncbi:MAG: hypothetical protein ACR2MX_06950 [Cyclobacteriaceae bacterium]
MKRASVTLLCLVPFFLFNLSSEAQSPTETKQDQAHDVASMDMILKVLYEVISGEKEVKRDWPRFLNLFAPGAQLIPTRPDGNGKPTLDMMSPQEYIDLAGAYLESNGFFEVEIARKVDKFGPIVQVFSTYESKHSASDQEPFARGINSIQLLNDGDRWWIVNIYWTSETDKLSIPEVYLPE